MNNLKTEIMKGLKTDNKLEQLKESMSSNGYSWFDYDNYKAKNDKPCFICENAEDLYDVESWQSMYKTVLETIKTKDFLLAVAYNYGLDNLMDSLEGVEASNIEFEDTYLKITEQTPEQFAETFMDDYFLGGDEVWCSIYTKLEDYTY